MYAYICSFRCVSTSLCNMTERFCLCKYECHMICILMYFKPVTCYLGNHHLPATAKKYPIYGTQWHPEKNVFEWTTKEGINHSEHAIMITQTAVNFFVSEGECLICCTRSPMCLQIMNTFSLCILKVCPTLYSIHCTLVMC